jgi:hypothetical protein
MKPAIAGVAVVLVKRLSTSCPCANGHDPQQAQSKTGLRRNVIIIRKFENCCECRNSGISTPLPKQVIIAQRGMQQRGVPTTVQIDVRLSLRYIVCKAHRRKWRCMFTRLYIRLLSLLFPVYRKFMPAYASRLIHAVRTL